MEVEKDRLIKKLQADVDTGRKVRQQYAEKDRAAARESSTRCG